MVAVNKVKIAFRLLMTLMGCGFSIFATGQVIVSLDSATVISRGYLGNGVQWDPYCLDYGHGRFEISDEDMAKIYRRLDFMRPWVVRMMINASSLADRDGNPDFDHYYGNVAPLLEYCRTRGVNVIFGDWGGSLISSKEKKINRKNILNAVSFVRYLLDEKKMDCIRYFNFVNEPNGYWSATDGDFALWQDGMKIIHVEMEKQGIASRISLIGPDAAIWTKDETWWVERSASEIGDIIGLYDIHTYPSKFTVNTNQYYDIIKAYRDCVPARHKIIMGEIGLKYVAPEDKALSKLNMARAKNAKNASVDDSQMSVYDFSYGIDMADALIQTLHAGYSGTVAWMLDDAMHNNEAPDKLKIWGFWNTFGDEFFGAEQEKIRPWFYAWSMLCRAIPQDSEILTAISDMPEAIKSALVRKNGKYSLILLNITDANLGITIKGTPLPTLTGCKLAVYSEQSLYNLKDELSVPGEKSVESPNIGDMIDVPAKSLVIISNMF